VILPASVVADGALSLREWREADAPQLVAAVAASRDHLAPWMEWASEPIATVAEQRERIRGFAQRRRDGGDGVYGMFLGDRLAGGCGLHRRIGPDALEIGYWVHVDFTRRGIATAAAAALTDVAFTDDLIRYVEIRHDAANLASGAVPRRLGFALVGESSRPPTAPGESDVERRWRLTREQWLDAARPPGGRPRLRWPRSLRFRDHG
jgi:ribosomal-protein-serine acetyltransferase